MRTAKPGPDNFDELTAAYHDRISTVSAETRKLFETVVKTIEQGDRDNAAAMLAPALTLIEAAIVAINEIALAQTKLAALAEAELAWAMKMQAEGKAEAEELARKREEEKTNPKRRYLGQRD